VATEVRQLTVWQPWASALALGLKRYETRTWRTHYTGLIAIHAGRWAPRHVVLDLLAALADTEALRAFRTDIVEARLPTGVVLGVRPLLRCTPTEELQPWVSVAERNLGDWTPGRWAWEFGDPVPCAAGYRCHGWQGLRRLSFDEAYYLLWGLSD
jgi:hypothetical protein